MSSEMLDLVKGRGEWELRKSLLMIWTLRQARRFGDVTFPVIDSIEAYHQITVLKDSRNTLINT